MNENIEIQSGEEREDIPDYASEAADLIARAPELAKDDLTPLLNESQKLIDTILDRADKGDITGSVGLYSRELLVRQFKLLNEDILHPDNGQNPFMKIPSWGKMRQGFASLLTSEQTGRVFMDALTATIQEHDKSRELLVQEVSDEVGDIGIEATGLHDDLGGALKPSVNAAMRVVEGVDYDDLVSGKDDAPKTVEGAAVRFESEEEKLARERKNSDDVANALNRIDRPEMN